jgi:DNA-binding NarL/FixJ family response regulator
VGRPTSPAPARRYGGGAIALRRRPRAILGLRSPIPPETGLVGAIEAYAERFAEASKLAVAVRASDVARGLELAMEVEAQVFRIVQEALTNVRKHASARRIEISVAVEGDRLVVIIADDGRGFEAASSGVGAWPHYGLEAMRERAGAIGGSIEWTAGTDAGAVVRLAVPAVPAVAPSARPWGSADADRAGRRPCAVFDDLSSSLLGRGHEVVGLAADGTEAVDLVERIRPELVLMDVRMPGMNGLEATRLIAQDRPEIAIVMLTVSENEDDLFAAIKAGARGYLLKNLEAAQLRSMIEAVGRGEVAITPATAARIMSELARPAVATDPGPDRLTDREIEVLELVTAGLRNKEIGARLGISENTAKFHLRNILEKLHAESRTELAARAVREGLVRGD